MMNRFDSLYNKIKRGLIAESKLDDEELELIEKDRNTPRKATIDYGFGKESEPLDAKDAPQNADAKDSEEKGEDYWISKLKKAASSAYPDKSKLYWDKMARKAVKWLRENRDPSFLKELSKDHSGSDEELAEKAFEEYMNNKDEE